MSDFNPVVFEDLKLDEKNKILNTKNMNVLYDVPVVVKAKLGKATLTVEEILRLDIDCIIELDTSVGDLVEIYANDVLIGYGEIVVLNEDIGIKVVKINHDSFAKLMNNSI